MALPSHIGKFEVVSRLGEGGMGVVYLAKDPGLNRMVAIKVLTGYADEAAYDDLRERFAREARSVASLTHHNIVTIHEIGNHEGRPFIAMEFLDGETMAELIRRRAPLPAVRKLGLMVELCAGLGFAHRNSIIHRDIKPANLMITASRGLKILDFGLARATSDLTHTGLTRAGMLLGTPYYMAPEQIEGKPVDTRSDIFAVGIVLYELLTYRKAFDGDSPHAVLHNILVKTPTPVRDLIPSVDPDLERIVARGLEKDPSLRYQTLEVLGADLQRFADRLRADESGETVVMSGSSPGAEAPPRSTPRSTPRAMTPRTGQKIPNLEAISQRRQAQIDLYLSNASGHLAAGRYDEAIQACENVVVIDPREPRALEMLEVAHRRIEDNKVRDLLDKARAELSRGSLTAAETLVVESLALHPDSADALQMQLQIRDLRRERERAAERARAVRLALDRARASFADGALEAAGRSVREAIAIDPANEEARALSVQIAAGIEDAERRRDAEAAEAVARAQNAAEREDFSSAFAVLDTFGYAHPVVAEARAGIEQLRDEVARRRAAEDAARREREDAARREREAQARRAAEDASRREREAQAQRVDAQRQRLRIEGERLISEAIALVDRDDLDGARELVQRAVGLVPDLGLAREWRDHIDALIEARRLEHAAADERDREAAEAAIAQSVAHAAAQAPTHSIDEPVEDRTAVGAPPAYAPRREEYERTMPAEPAEARSPVRRPPVDRPVSRRRLLVAITTLLAVAGVVGATYRWWPRHPGGGTGAAIPTGVPAGGAGAISPAPGLVAMDLQPWAKVHFEGQDGVTAPTQEFITPFQVSLPPGRYLVKCENTDLKLTAEFPIEVKSGEGQSISRRLEGFNPDAIVSTLMGRPGPREK